MDDGILKLREIGQSIWLDNIQRRELSDGTLQRMIKEDGICGITSNPTIFMNAVTKSRDYDEQILTCVKQGKTPEEIYHHIIIDDIRAAARLLMPVYEETSKQDGFVSIELNPQIAFDTDKSLSEAREFISEISLPNIMIKVPGTVQGFSVVKQLVAEGINVNITLLFSPDRYKQAANAYIEGLEERVALGKDIDDINSVASFFISRIDTSADRQIDEISRTKPEHAKKISLLRGKTAVNTARLTYSVFRELFSSPRFKSLQEKGAQIQRPLWASTGTKDPSYSDVKYVEELIAPDTVNTLPPKTMAAFKDHGVVKKAIENTSGKAPMVIEQIGQCGIKLDSVYEQLQDEGVKAFEKSYLDLLKSIEEKGETLCG